MPRNQGKQKRLKLGVFYDGRPGHEKQTRGIVEILSQLALVDVTEIELERKTFWRELCGWLEYFLSTKTDCSQHSAEFDLLIGTGSRTHIPMLLYKKKFAVPVVTCMSPSPLLIDHFDLCFIPQHDGISDRENVYKTIGPPNCSVTRGEQHADRGLILLGGIDNKSHQWQTETIEKYLDVLLQDENIRYWTITSSPRTPFETVRMVEEFAAGFNNVDFFRFEDTERGWVERQYNRNKFVWVTADSMSMVYEALTAGCSVGLLPVVWRKKKSKFRRSEEFLIKEGLVVSFDAWAQDVGQWQVQEPLNEAARCADEILKRW